MSKAALSHRHPPAQPDAPGRASISLQVLALLELGPQTGEHLFHSLPLWPARPSREDFAGVLAGLLASRLIRRARFYESTVDTLARERVGLATAPRPAFALTAAGFAYVSGLEIRLAVYRSVGELARTWLALALISLAVLLLVWTMTHSPS